MVWAQPSENQVGIGDGDLVSPAVAGRAGVCSGRLRTDRQGAATVQPGDGASAGAHCVYLDHGDADGVAPHRRAGCLLDASRTQGDVGGCSAHIEGNYVRVACLDSGMEGAPTTPPAGPLKMVRTGCSDASRAVILPPEDCMIRSP